MAIEGAEAVFARLLAIYGSRFTHSWAGADAELLKRLWGTTLMRFSEQQVRDALETCATSVKHPPTLPEFFELCREAYIPPPREPIEFKGAYVPSPVDERELQVMREIPKPRNGLGDWWARRIIRRQELGIEVCTAALDMARQVVRDKP